MASLGMLDMVLAPSKLEKPERLTPASQYRFRVRHHAPIARLWASIATNAGAGATKR
jgi:hypothetical protein